MHKVFAVSLGIAISSQSIASISHADSLNSSSDNDVYIKNKTQADPEENKTYSMGGDLSISSRINEVASSMKTINLSNPKAIGSGSVISTTSLNVRSGPSTTDKIIGTLNPNKTIEILGKNNDWYKVDYNGKEGYISSNYLKLNPIEKGIDVSKWNGNINWKSVKASGIDYVIIRAGYGSSTVDTKFKTYIEGAKNAGLKIGVYWFSYATSTEKAIAEAKKCLETISPYKNSITYPVFFDYEYASVDYAKSMGVNITKNSATNMANAFINTVKSQGYSTGIYTNKDFSRTYFTDDLTNSNTLWVAQYSSTNTFGKPYSMWQFSERGSVPGISGYVDLNYTYLKTFTNNGSSAAAEKGITITSVNFRNSASTSSSIITTIPRNTTINIIDKSISGWYKIEYKGVTGYVSSDYVTLDSGNIDDDTINKPSTSSQEGITTTNLNFRNSASTSSSIITTIPKDTTIKIIDKSTSGWYKIEYKGVTGYVSSEYVTINGSNTNNSTSTPSTSTQKGVTTDNLNLRKSASTSSSIIATIPKNTTIEIVDKSTSGWYKVKYNNNTGYVSSSYVTTNGSNTNNSTSTTPSTSTQKGVTTANLNFRKSDSTSSSIISTIPKDTTIEIVEKSTSGWYKIKYKGVTGYVSGGYIKI